MQKDKSLAQPGNTGKLKNGTEERYTAVYNSDTLDDLKNIAYWSRKKIKDTINSAFADFIEAWKKDPQNKSYTSSGKIKQRPEGE